MQVQGGVLDTHVRRRAVAGQAHAHPCQGAHPPAAASSCTSACSHLRHALPCMWHHAVATLFSEKVIEAVQWPAESRVTCQMDKKQPTPMHCLAKIPKALPGSAEPRAAAQMFKKVLKADWPRPARYSQRSSAPGSTHAVKAESEYKVQSDPDNEVPPDMRTRAYMARPARTWFMERVRLEIMIMSSAASGALPS